MSGIKVRLGVGGLVAILVAAGCGSDEERDDATSSSSAEAPLPTPREGDPSKAAYIDQIDRLCERYVTATYRAGREAGKPIIEGYGPAPTTEEMAEVNAAVLEGARPVAERYLDEMVSLPRPDEDEAELEQFWMYVFDAAALNEPLIEAYGSGDAARYQEAREDQILSGGNVRFAALKYGFSRCWSGPNTPVGAFLSRNL